ncbi:thermonuclease family protein [Paenibacillus sp. N3/727]|uniref:thermonuclease family protein n=1 Tax=Paenibacillus sp. N3/727 TaxID=2925845 RepID=UPI001F53AA8F|nr:thermonuclease family protein [Paenibacillus sp. N3/727]UNK17537.1 thermonuclease family protein [Paenibacillus sp. N3/727]
MKRRILPIIITGLLLLSGCSDPLTTASSEQSNTDINTAAPNNSKPTTSKPDDKSYPTDDLNIPRVPVELVKTVDGDTISVKYEGKTEKVRFLLIDTPETSHPRLGVQPFGPEAKAFTKEIVEKAEKLELEFDIGPNRDKYSRLLAYVYADGQMVQELLLEQGLARVAYIYQPNVRYVDKFNDLQTISRNKSLGIWSVENYAQDDGFHPEEQKSEKKGTTANTSSNTDKPKSGCNIKGNINSKGEKIYHTPESPYYERTKQEQWFCSENEAKQAGFRAPR